MEQREERSFFSLLYPHSSWCARSNTVFDFIQVVFLSLHQFFPFWYPLPVLSFRSSSFSHSPKIGWYSCTEQVVSDWLIPSVCVHQESSSSVHLFYHHHSNSRHRYFIVTTHIHRTAATPSPWQHHSDQVKVSKLLPLQEQLVRFLIVAQKA